MKQSQVGQFLAWAVAILVAWAADYYTRPVVESIVPDLFLAQAITMICDGAAALMVLSAGAAIWTSCGKYLTRPISFRVPHHH